jgi:hypothetical protein
MVEPTLRILWISRGRAVLEDPEGFRVDVLLGEIEPGDENIARLSPADAFRVGREAGLFHAATAAGIQPGD